MLADKYDGHYLKNSSKTGDGIFRIMKLLSRSLAQNSKSNDDIDNVRTVQLKVSKSQSCCRNENERNFVCVFITQIHRK